MDGREELKTFSCFRDKYQFLSSGYLVFSFILPICLHLENNFDFLVNLRGWPHPFIINTEECIEEYDPRYGNSKNAEVNSDIASAYRFTRLNIVFLDKNPTIPLEKIKELYENDVLKAVNHFLNAYRHITERHAINNIFSLSSVRSLIIYRGDKEGKEQFQIVIQFGVDGLLSTFLPFRSSEEHTRLKELALKDQPIPLDELLLMDAKRYSAIGYELQSLITAVTALEISIGNRKAKRSIRRMQYFLDFFLKNRRLQNKVKSLLNENLNTPKGLVGEVIFAIRERNRVVHDGKNFVKGDIKKHLESIRLAIKYIKDI